MLQLASEMEESLYRKAENGLICSENEEMQAKSKVRRLSWRNEGK